MVKFKALDDYNIPLLNLKLKKGKEYEVSEKDFNKIKRFSWIEEIKEKKTTKKRGDFK